VDPNLQGGSGKFTLRAGPLLVAVATAAAYRRELKTTNEFLWIKF